MYSILVGSHIAFALGAVMLGTYVLLTPKGTRYHRLIGRVWVILMALVALGSFGLRDLNNGGFSMIHVLSVLTLISIFYAIVMIRRGKRRAHYSAMIGSFIGTIIAGIFTLDPNRLIGGFFFGP